LILFYSFGYIYDKRKFPGQGWTPHPSSEHSSEMPFKTGNFVGGEGSELLFPEIQLKNQSVASFLPFLV